METLIDHKTLLKRFNDIKNELVEADESLTKLMGNRRTDSSFPGYKRKQIISSYNNSPLQNNFYKQSKPDITSESAEGSASEDESPAKKSSLRSAVITKRETNRSRKDLILKQNCNNKVQSRNRRMLGMVQNTLQRFQDEAVKRQSQDMKKFIVEQKVEAAKEEEKQLIKKQKAELVSKKHEKQLQLACLKEMLLLTESFEIWENNQKHLLNFIVTKSEPRICFLPASHTSASQKHLEKSKVKIEEIIQKQKAAIEKDLDAIKESFLTRVIAETKGETQVIKDDSCNKALEYSSVSCAEQKELTERNLSLHLSDDELIFSD